MLDSCIPINQRLGFVSRVLQKVFFSILLISNHLGSAISSRDQNSSQGHNCPNSQRHRSLISQRNRSPISQRHNSPISQRHKIRGSKIQTLVLLGQCSSAVHNESCSSSPGRPPTSCPGRRTKCNGCLPLSCAEA